MEVNHLSDAFRAARKSKRMSQAKLAVAVGCSKITIQRLESGTYCTGVDVPMRVSRALGIRFSAIIRHAEESAIDLNQ